MAYRPHVRLTFNGSMPGGERWSCSLAFGSDLALPWQPIQSELQTFADQALNVWSAFHVKGAALMSNLVRFERVDARVLDADNRTIRLAQASPGSVVQGNGNPNSPNQCALVVSLLTEVPGARGRGRIYLPTLRAAVGLDGRWEAAERGPMADAVKLLMDGLNTAAETAGYAETNALCVASGVGLGSNPDVRSIRMGDVIDTQRRRRDSIVESYTSRALALTS